MSFQIEQPAHFRSDENGIKVSDSQVRRAIQRERQRIDGEPHGVALGELRASSEAIKAVLEELVQRHSDTARLPRFELLD